MILPYRTQQTLRRLGLLALSLALIALAVLLCWFLWLQRYVVYTDEGARLDFNVSLQFPQGEAAVPPAPGATVEFVYAEDLVSDSTHSGALRRFTGFYIDLAAMAGGLDTIRQQLSLLPEGAAVMVDMKNVKGAFYYTTALGPTAEDVDLEELGRLLTELRQQGHYLIARIPAFQEYHYIMNDERGRVPHGLPRDGGNGSLWLDKQYGCYWLNPASDGALSYLMSIIFELRQQGFHEVVLADFRFPRTDMISFRGDQLEALNQAAATLVGTCTTDSFALSFVRDSLDLTVPQGRTRLYLTGAAAIDAATLAAQSGFADPGAQLVFLTELNDTRFDAYSVMRPLHMAR